MTATPRTARFFLFSGLLLLIAALLWLGLQRWGTLGICGTCVSGNNNDKEGSGASSLTSAAPAAAATPAAPAAEATAATLLAAVSDPQADAVFVHPELFAFLTTGSSDWSPEQVASALLELEPALRTRLLEHFMQLLEADGALDQQLSFIEALTEGLTATDAGAALAWLDSLNWLEVPESTGYAKIVELERELLHSWAETDFASLGAYLEYAGASNRQLDTLAAYYDGQEPARFTEWTEWIDGLADAENPENRSLQRAAAAATLLPEERSGRYQALAPVFARHHADGLYGLVPAFAFRYGEKSPEAAIEWVSDLSADAALQGEAVELLFETLSVEHQEYAVELLNDRAGFAQLLRGGDWAEKPPAERQAYLDELYDRALIGFFNDALNVSPQQALESAQAFNDPKLRQQYATYALEMLEVEQTAIEDAAAALQAQAAEQLN